MTLQGAQPFGIGKVAVIITGEIVDSNNQQIMALEFVQALAADAYATRRIRDWAAALTFNAKSQGDSP